jgi:hypothetical protein
MPVAGGGFEQCYRAGCEWKSVIGYSRFDDIKDLAIGNRYAVLMGKPFE